MQRKTQKIIGRHACPAMVADVRWWSLLALLMIAALIHPVSPVRAADFPFGLLLVGPRDDRGWSQVCHEAGQEIERRVPGTRMLLKDRVNPVDHPGVDLNLLVENLRDLGARVIIGNSDDMRMGLLEAARRYPDIRFIHLSGDDARHGRAPANLTNLMGRMEFTRMMSGFVAALTSQTGRIGYVGPLINDETRRLAAATYLGARYAWTQVLGRLPEKLHFTVEWIGFWFFVPDISRSPRDVSQALLGRGHDVLVSGIDTPEPLLAVQGARREGRRVWAVAYDSPDGCAPAPEVCLGTAYYNWFPGLRRLILQEMEGKGRQHFLWLGPDWRDINDRATSSVGFLPGQALTPEQRRQLQEFIAALGKGSLNLFRGPLNFQDGSVFLAAGEEASDEQIWRLPQLLEGMAGASN